MRKIDRRIVITVSLIFIIGLAYGLMRYLISLKEEPPMRPANNMLRFVQTDTVKYSDIFSPVEAPGRISSTSQVDLISEASGKISTQSIPLKKGAKFNKGDILFSIYPDEARLALQAKKSLFLNSLANILPDLSIDFPDQEEVFRDFFNRTDIEKPLPQLPEIASEKLKIFLSSRNIFSDYLNIQKDELALSRRTVRAEFEGTYLNVYLEEGAYTNTGGRVATAIRTDQLELEVPLERVDADWVKTGDRVRVISDRSRHEWKGTVIRKNQFIDAATQSQGVFIQLYNNNSIPLLAGEYLHAHFKGHPIDNVMEIPRNAVFNTNEVFLVIDNRLEKRRINIIKINERTLLFNGLEEGHLIVVQPLINVLEGTQVRVREESTKKQMKKAAKKEK